MKEEAPEFENGDVIKVHKFESMFSTQVTPSVILTGDRVSLSPDGSISF